MGGHYEGVPPPWPKQSFGIKWIPQGTCFRDWDMYILRGCTPPNAHFVGVDTWTWLGTGCQHQEHQVQSALSLKLSQGAGNCWFLCSNPGSLGFFLSPDHEDVPPPSCPPLLAWRLQPVKHQRRSKAIHVWDDFWHSFLQEKIWHFKMFLSYGMWLYNPFPLLQNPPK